MNKLQGRCAAVIMLQNEEYWLDYVLRPLANTPNLPIYIADVGSTDRSIQIIEYYARQHPDFHFFNLGKISAEENGQLRSWMAHKTGKPWILQVDGDEIWTRTGIDATLGVDMDDYPGGFVTHQNVVFLEDGWHYANRTSHMRIHRSDEVWIRQYPYETTMSTQKGLRYYYLDVLKVMGYHMRFVERSSKDAETYARMSKFGCFGDPPVYEPFDLFKVIGTPRYTNPYWGKWLQLRWPSELAWLKEYRGEFIDEQYTK